MQRAQLKRILPLAVFAGNFLWSNHVNGLKYIPIFEPLAIRAQKSSPPHIAFEAIISSEQSLKSKEINLNSKVALLTSGATLVQTVLNKRIQLPEMIFKKNVERVVAGTSQVEGPSGDFNDWMNELPRSQALRLQEAQRRSEVLNQNWSDRPWVESVKEEIQKSGALASSPTPSKIFVAASDANGKMTTDRSRPNIGLLPSDSSTASFVEQGQRRSVNGPLEINGGLAVTNDHHIEIRRNDEGVLKELGSVDLQKGVYIIDVEDTTGSIVARLVDREGKILGEGSFRMSRVSSQTTRSVVGPKISIQPQPSFAGTVTSAYGGKLVDSNLGQARATFVKGAADISVKRDGTVAMDNVTKGSTTVFRVAAPNNLQTAEVILAGEEFRTELFNKKMIQALQDIVSQQRSESVEGEPSIIWGRVSLDGKTLSGVDLSVESAQDLQPIYFNQFMIPDPSLKSTGENGLFAFINVPPGFHSLMANRGDSIFGYKNVIVEEGSVSQGDVMSTAKVETIPLRLYDAFTGARQSAVVSMQSLQTEIEVPEGSTTVTLPQVARMGMIRVVPEQSDYVAARYMYNDKEDYIHLPLVQWAWLGAIKTYLRLEGRPSAGHVVGFVPQEDFEVYLAGEENLDPRQIVYFDMQGKIIQKSKGVAGGGFIIYNVPTGTQEVVVVGSQTQKIYSRVLPVDPNSLGVLSFHE